MKKKKQGLPREIVAVTLYVVIIGLLNFFTDNYNGLNGGTGAYSFYRGPVLPMTGIAGAESLEVERNVNFDFSQLSTDRERIIRGQEAVITDDYCLTNPTGEAVTATLAYPFEGAAARPLEEIPAIRVNGEEVPATIAASADVDRILNRANSWEDYRELLTKTDYLAQASAPAPVLSQKVTVYHFANITHKVDAPLVFLQIYFQKPEDCTIWAFNWKSGGWDARDGAFEMMFQATPEGTGEGYLLVSGAKLPEIQQRGNIGYNTGEQYRTEGVTCDLNIYESSLEEMLWVFSGKYDPFQEEGTPMHALVTPEFLYEGAAKHLETGKYSAGGTGYISLDSVFYAVANQSSLCYRIFDVTVQPGETVSVSAEYCKEGSEDNGGFQEQHRYGFDMATRLASNLHFTAQTASISGFGQIEILSQNFGFDPQNGILQVTLDLTKERYYIDVAVTE